MGRSRFIWHELLTRDFDIAAAFYSQMFGWKTRIHDLGPLGPYTVIHDGERESSGMAELRNRFAGASWIPFIAVDNISRVAKATVFYGGNIIGGPYTIPGIGEYLQIVDDLGCEMTLVAPEPGELPPARPRVGVFCDHIFNTIDIAKSAKFYEAVLGWQLKVVDIGGPKKIPIFVYDRARTATIYKLPKDVDRRAHWTCAVGVKNLAVSHKRGLQFGATSLLPPTRAGKLGSVSVLADPVGALFALYEPQRVTR